VSYSVRFVLADPGATAVLGDALAAAISAARPVGLTVHLSGGLGAGKTALARAVLRGLGYRGRVPSPTYTLVEPYEAGGYRVVHADLYRLVTPGDADDLGLREALGAGTLALVEWPERGAGRLPPPDLRVALELAGSGRQADLHAVSPAGRAVLRELGQPPLKSPV
jgi:tRNA threonylcarbamoyladenosine biosynthesis protein TsaE